MMPPKLASQLKQNAKCLTAYPTDAATVLGQSSYEANPERGRIRTTQPRLVVTSTQFHSPSHRTIRQTYDGTDFYDGSGRISRFFTITIRPKVRC
jgi:hypothetical protein